jgi:hypothetical protein
MIAQRRGIYRLCDWGAGVPAEVIVDGSAAKHLAKRIGADWPRTGKDWPSGKTPKHQAKRIEPGWETFSW